MLWGMLKLEYPYVSSGELAVMKRAMLGASFGAEGIQITNFGTDVDCFLASPNIGFFLPRHWLIHPWLKRELSAWTHAGRKFFPCWKMNFGAWKPFDANRASIFQLIGWSLPAITDYQETFSELASSEVTHGHRNKINVRPKFSLGMFLTGFPQQIGRNEQTNGKNSHDCRANGDDFSIVFSDKFARAFDKALFATFMVFFFSGPLIGFAFLFLNRWIGGSIMLGWLCLICYTLSGVWKR